MKSVIVTVSPEGEIIVEAVGFKGGACARATEAIEIALGITGKRTKKPEYSQEALSTQKVGGA